MYGYYNRCVARGENAVPTAVRSDTHDVVPPCWKDLLNVFLSHLCLISLARSDTHDMVPPCWKDLLDFFLSHLCLISLAPLVGENCLKNI